MRNAELELPRYHAKHCHDLQCHYHVSTIVVPVSKLCVHVGCRYGPCEIADLQERMKRAVALLGEEEVKNIMRDEGKIEVGVCSDSSLAQYTTTYLMTCFDHDAVYSTSSVVSAYLCGCRLLVCL